MKEYDFVHVHVASWSGSSLTEHRKIIAEYALKGYRYVGYVPTEVGMDGCLEDIDLIFEKDAE